MLEVQKDIVDWLHQQPDWLQGAAEKLLESHALSESEMGDVIAHLKTDAGQQATTHRTFENLAATTTGRAELRLLSVGDIRGIENLAPRSPLEFGSGNLVVVYGPNGSGKSGYTRILKKACGKPRAAELKTNVFQDPPASRGCKIAYQVGEVKHELDWVPGGDALVDLRPVDIFDAETASFYLSRESEATYTPPMVALFENLARVCEQVKTKLQGEKSTIVSKLPTLPPEFASTTAGKAFQSLSHDLMPEAIEQLKRWAPEEQATLDRLIERLEVADPAMSARQKRSIKSQLIQLAKQIQEASEALSEEKLSLIRKACEDAQRKRRLSNEAAKVQTQSAQLEGIGEDTWHALWKAARAFSLIPYPDQDFPVTADGSRCVLCQQVLAPDAQQRMRDFEDFVQGKFETEARAAESAYEDQRAELPIAPSPEETTTQLAAAGIVEESQVSLVIAFWERVSKVSATLKQDETDEGVAPIPPPTEFLAELAARAEAFEKEALQHDQDAKDFDRTKATAAKVDLEAKRWVSQQSEAITQEIARLKQVETFDKWTRLANSRNISNKAGEIAEKVITDAYVTRFNQELAALGAVRVKVKLVKTRTERGKALHRLALKDAKAEQPSLESVLSEGERRVVSLAAFLADVADKPFSAPFVFDDPISSLDHDFEWSVAMRLAELARERQVLVFTHRLSLYGAMEDAAKKLGDKWKDDNLCNRYIEAFGGFAGHPANEAAWNTNTRKANNILLERLNSARRAGEADGPDAYKPLAQAICSDFRKLVERSVEEDLLHKVVLRHRRKVTTENCLVKLPKIRLADCRLLDDLMTKYSCYEHSQSFEAPTFLPDEPELRADLIELQRWRTEFNGRDTADA